MSTEEVPKKKGRPLGSGSSLTPQAVEIICKGVRLGMNFKSAALQAGVKEKTFAQWMEKGRVSRSGIYADFVSQMQAAVEDSKAFHLNNLHICSQGEEYEEVRTEYDRAGKVLKKEVSKVPTVSEARPKNITPPILIFSLIWPQVGLAVQ